MITDGASHPTDRVLAPYNLLVVRASVDPDGEAEFNRWYDEEHLRNVARLPGCTGAARYRVLSESATAGAGAHQYMAVYAFASGAALQEATASAYFRELIRRYDAAVGGFSRRVRTTYTRIAAVESPR